MCARIEAGNILKAIVPIDEVSGFFDELPERAKRLKDDAFHITLLHQKYAKPNSMLFASVLGLLDTRLEHLKVPFLDPPKLWLGSQVHHVARQGPEKEAWIVLCANQDSWRRYVNKLLYAIGDLAEPEPRRVYHATIANLKGDPFSSIGDVCVDDLA